MKKFVLVFTVLFIVAAFSVPFSSAAFAAEGDFVGTYPSRSAYLIDYDTGTVLVDKNSDEKRPIASMVKIMTLLLTFNEIDAGRLTLDEKIVVSPVAAGMGGSQMFLDAGKEYPVSDLIKGVTVCSANDAAVALGERISDTIESFVTKMNDYAKELGMENTVFCNATGLPHSGEQYSTAKDVSIMFRKLLDKKKYYEYAGIWMENYTHPDGRETEMVNTNKLIRFCEECDAGKTGYTDDAKYCLAASAKKNDMRVVGVVLGSDSSKERFREMTDLFRYAFSNYEVKTYVKANERIENDVKVAKAKQSGMDLYAEKDVKVFLRKGKNSNPSLSIELSDGLCAPIEQGAVVGKILLTLDGVKVSESNLICGKTVEKRGYGDAMDDVLEKWIKQ